MSGCRLVLLVATLALLSGSALASDPHEDAVGISKEVMSPFCPGITLHDCPSRAALDLRDRIEGWVRLGWSEDRIFDELVAEYGESILAIPDGPLTRASRLLPWAAIAGGGFFVWRWINRWQARVAADPRVRATTPAERAVLDAELDELRSTP